MKALAATNTGDRIVARYRFESPLSPEQAALSLARFLSAGTYVRTEGESERLRSRFAARVEELEVDHVSEHPSLPTRWSAEYPASRSWHQGTVDLSVPLETTGVELTAILSTCCGGIFEMKEVSGLRLLDLQLPSAVIQSHPGPQFGVAGTRRLTGVNTGPILASIIKPNVGLTPEETAAKVRVLAEAGVDFVKDDEKMTSPAYSPLERRVAAVTAVLEDFRQRTGKKVMYAFNITADDPDRMQANHDLVCRSGGSCVMVSVNQVGISGLSFLRRRCALPIHGHRNGWGMLTRCPMLGMGFPAYQKIWRLAGVDHLHVNGIRNKFWEDDSSVEVSVSACLEPLAGEQDRILPVLGSGMWAGQVPDSLYRFHTTDLMYIAGGGIQGHPLGTAAGVASIRQALEAAAQGIALAEYGHTHPELKAALEAFGTKQESR